MSAEADDPLAPGSGAFRTVLVPERQSLLPFALFSGVFHVVAASSIWGVTAFVSVLSAFVPMCSTPPPIVESLEVSVVSLPKSKSNVPDRASRVERAAGVEQAEAPPPVQESDLALKAKVPDPKKGNVDDSQRQALIDQIKRQQLLDEMMNAADGPVDRNATDPDGVEGAAIAALGAGAKGDPEFGRWMVQVQQIVLQHFKPIAAITEGRKDLKCQLSVDLDPATGDIRGYSVSSSSGVFAFDQAAERAMQQVPKLPPPPTKYAPWIAAEGVVLSFTPP